MSPVTKRATEEGGAPGISWAVLPTPHNAQDKPTAKEDLAQNVDSAAAEKLYYESRTTSATCKVKRQKFFFCRVRSRLIRAIAP